MTREKEIKAVTQEDSLLLKDLCGRILYGVKALYYNPEEERETYDEVEGIFNDGQVDIGQYGLEIWKIKPYLFPLTSMSISERNEIVDILGCDFPWDIRKEEFEWTVGDSVKSELFTLSIDQMERLMQFLNSHHYDYRGLIPKGLAIDATGLYIYKEDQP